MGTDLNTGKTQLICIWPHSAIQELNPIQMAAAGFYLAIDVHQPQQIDRVKCYMCGIVVAGWTVFDRPTDKHKQIAPDCPFVLRLFGREHIFNSKLDNATFNRFPPVLKRGTFYTHEIFLANSQNNLYQRQLFRLLLLKRLMSLICSLVLESFLIFKH